jgi:hypothetical protein
MEYAPFSLLLIAKVDRKQNTFTSRVHRRSSLSHDDLATFNQASTSSSRPIHSSLPSTAMTLGIAGPFYRSSTNNTIRSGVSISHGTISIRFSLLMKRESISSAGGARLTFLPVKACRSTLTTPLRFIPVSSVTLSITPSIHSSVSVSTPSSEAVDDDDEANFSLTIPTTSVYRPSPDPDHSFHIPSVSGLGKLGRRKKKTDREGISERTVARGCSYDFQGNGQGQVQFARLACIRSISEARQGLPARYPALCLQTRHPRFEHYSDATTSSFQ